MFQEYYPSKKGRATHFLRAVTNARPLRISKCISLQINGDVKPKPLKTERTE